MIAEILAVGTELLLGDIANTNAQFLSRELAKLGIPVYGHLVVGDNPGRMRAAFEYAFSKADLVIAIGGLGPTQDDITKEIAAEYFKKPLVLHEETWTRIQVRFNTAIPFDIDPVSISNDARGACAQRLCRCVAIPHEMWNCHNMEQDCPENNKRQALLPEGCEALKNNNGSAAGVYLEQDGKTLILLPGPPGELEPMFLHQAVPFLRKKTDGVFVSRTLKTVGLGESLLETKIQDLIENQGNPTIALYADTGETRIRLTASAHDTEQAHAIITPIADELYQRLGVFIYGENDDNLPLVVLQTLREKGLTLACAESCTGGMLFSALVDIPGFSDVLLESAVTYGNQAKMNRLGVSADMLNVYGAVSAETAAAMAEGVAKTSGAKVGVSTTGIAGPDGGTAEKPVGLVYVGLYIEGKGVRTKELRLSGNRNTIRKRSVVSGLDFLRKELLNGD